MNGRLCDRFERLNMLQEIAPWIGGLGIGSVIGSAITAIVQWKLNVHIEEKKRNFNEKKDAYIGLLSALRNANLNKTKEAAIEYAFWLARVELVGHKEVVVFANSVKDSAPNSKEMDASFKGLISEMRRDLNIN